MGLLTAMACAIRGRKRGRAPPPGGTRRIQRGTPEGRPGESAALPAIRHVEPK